MGKMVNLIVMLICVDILFLITGQIELSSTSSVIQTAITNPEGLEDSNFWTVLVTGIAALAVLGGVVVSLFTKSDSILFITMAIGLSLLIGDYVNIYSYLASVNTILATVLFVPIIVLFTLIVVEWARGKD